MQSSSSLPPKKPGFLATISSRRASSPFALRLFSELTYSSAAAAASHLFAPKKRIIRMSSAASVEGLRLTLLDTAASAFERTASIRP